MNTRRLYDAPFVSALAVGATDREQIDLERIFRDSGWKLHRVRTRSEACAFLDGTPVGVVIGERNLFEGGWRAMLGDLLDRSEPPVLVVTTRLADESFWAEVLNMGAYDVLAEPLDNEEVTRVVSAAARQFASEQQRRAPAMAAPLIFRAAS
jgi:DNA-binding response OmpR family regulator